MVSDKGREDKGIPEICRIISGGDSAAIRRRFGRWGTVPERGVPKESPKEFLYLTDFL
jgi:hypothetical protein